MGFEHIPVLLAQCIEGLDIRPDGIYLDGTAGGAGPSQENAPRAANGRPRSLGPDPPGAGAARAIPRRSPRG